MCLFPSPMLSSPEWVPGNEAILRENADRFCMFPVQHRSIWELYKKAVASFWTVEEVDLSQDNQDWLSLSNDERHFISTVLAFFAASDGIVLENLAVRFFQGHLLGASSAWLCEHQYCHSGQQIACLLS